MASLKAVSITTKYSACGCDDSSSESEFSNSSDSFPEPDCSESVPVTDSSDDDCEVGLQNNPSPLYFLYDCEGTGGSIYKDHIVEIAAVLQPLANIVETHLEKSFHSLVNTSRIAAPGKKQCFRVTPIQGLPLGCEIMFQLNLELHVTLCTKLIIFQ